ncbi:MAG: PQQ-dependent sugar dehydrogenase [Bacteroidales bacterium]|nr:PQQ-dependent sugar dehydrogenase [Bacteroidales bacterium]
MNTLINRCQLSTNLILMIILLTGCKSKYKNDVTILYEGEKIPGVDFEEASLNYKNYCAGCHGNNLEAFVNRDWVYGKDPDNVFISIKEGKSDIGMPGFKEAFTDKQVNDLVYYLLIEGKEKTFTASVESEGESVHVTEKQRFKVDTVLSGMNIPWGMEFLPNGDLLVSERAKLLLRLTRDGRLDTIQGLPEIFRFGQGGLLDIELHPNYEKNGWIYLAYSYPAPNPKKDGGNTAIMRAKIEGNMLTSHEVLFKAEPYTRKGAHFGCRLEFDRKGYLYFSVGDRGQRNNAQLLDNHNGKIHRIFDDGSIPSDNPFVNNPQAKQTIYSYGHRNPQGVAMHPETGEIWTHEHGPKGGDEVNIIQKGKNYGWPKITYGINYNGTIITKDTAMAGMEQPLIYYVPSIAPCGMTFVKGNLYKGWKNSLLIGSLRFMYLERCEVVGNKIVHQEKLLEGIGRVRNVEMSPDGYIYVAIEKPGKILKLIPIE